MDDKTQAHHEREGFFGAAKVVAGLTVLSRVLGMVRDMAIYSFGATRSTDAFWTAFTIPNLFRRLFGEGALSAAFVPVFTEVSEAEGWHKARLVLANAAGVLALLLAGLVLIGEVILLAALLWIRPGADWLLLGQLSMLVLPFMFTICLLALGSAALNCKGHFAYPAFAPILLNICLIAAAWIAHEFLGGDQWRGLFALAISVVVAGVVQLAGVVWLLRSARLAGVPRLTPVGPEVRRIARLVLPMMIPLGILQFSAFFDRLYAWVMTATADSPAIHLFGMELAKPLSVGVGTRLYAAARLYNFPLGILAISVATVVFPLFSRYASRGDRQGLREATNRALRLSLFMGIPAGVGLIVLARPLVTLICLHGNFTSDDVSRTAPILQMYCLGMGAYFCNHILLRAFFAQKDTATPLRIAGVLAAVNMLLVVTGVFTPLRAQAIGLASACTATANTLLLVRVLRRRWGRFGGRRVLASAARGAVATAAMAGAALGAVHLLGPSAQRLGAAWSVKAGAGLLTAAGVTAGVAAFVIVALALRCPELGELLRKRGAPPPIPE